MVGIDKVYFTDFRIAKRLKKIKKSNAFHGKLVLIPCQYGDGKTFLFQKKKNRLIFHCQLVELQN